jgi:hypothetical protein
MPASRWRGVSAIIRGSFVPRGFMVAESSNAPAIAKFMQDWTDLLSFEVTPVITDEELAGVILSRTIQNPSTLRRLSTIRATAVAASSSVGRLY